MPLHLGVSHVGAQRGFSAGLRRASVLQELTENPPRPEPLPLPVSPINLCGISNPAAGNLEPLTQCLANLESNATRRSPTSCPCLLGRASNFHPPLPHQSLEEAAVLLVGWSVKEAATDAGLLEVLAQSQQELPTEGR